MLKAANSRPVLFVLRVTMEEYLLKQKIQEAYFEPRAPEELVSRVILQVQAVAMGAEAQKQLETASADRVASLAARALIGQLAMGSPLPPGAQPEELARQLQEEPAFTAALYGGNVLRRIQNGELIQQVTNPRSEKIAEQKFSLEKKNERDSTLELDPMGVGT